MVEMIVFDSMCRMPTTSNFFWWHCAVFGNDEPLTAANYNQQANREWKSSIISPMATNIAAIRYDCPGGDNDILFLINEQPLVIPGCQSNGLCKVSFIRQRYGRFIGANCTVISCSETSFAVNSFQSNAIIFATVCFLNIFISFWRTDE
ncbi:hypothetical protein HA402_014860 [Bradysia odoriphaga]|nr:hypothetical protein HA402_014860 [Bradysia odoriphaga]